MDETSWRAKLAKSNINILSVTIQNKVGISGFIYKWFFEFTYHPKPGVFKWCKTYLDMPEGLEEDMAEKIMDEVSRLRRELED